jgi:hypothetical protein
LDLVKTANGEGSDTRVIREKGEGTLKGLVGKDIVTEGGKKRGRQLRESG